MRQVTSTLTTLSALLIAMIAGPTAAVAQVPPVLTISDNLGDRVTIDGAGTVTFGGTCTVTSCGTAVLLSSCAANPAGGLQVSAGSISWSGFFQGPTSVGGNVAGLQFCNVQAMSKPKLTSPQISVGGRVNNFTGQPITVTIQWSDTGFIPGGSPATMTADAATLPLFSTGTGRGTGSNVTFQGFVDGTNMLNGEQVLVNAITFPNVTGSTTQAATATGPGPAVNPFSMTEVETFTMSGSAPVNSDPESGASYFFNNFTLMATPHPPVSGTCVSITAVQGVPITPVTMTGTGGVGGPYTFTATGLPAGLTMSPMGSISGTPTVSGIFPYTVTVTDSAGNTGTVNCSVTVNPPPTANCVSITAVQGAPITPVTMTGSGGVGGPYTFTATGLPAGLTISSNGTISGTPTVTGTFPYTVTVMDSAGNTGTVNCSVTVNPPPMASCVSITAVAGNPITPVTMTGSGGVGGPYTFTATGLPPGLTISSSGTISGTPTVSGTFNYTVTVTDRAGNTGTVNCSVSVNPPPTASCVSITAVAGNPITPVTMVGSGGVGGPYTFTATGLPPGVTISSSGTISGTPTTSGTFNYTVTVTDKAGNTGTVNCSVTVAPPGPPILTCPAVLTATVGVPFNSGPASVTGGVPPYTFFIIGTLPPGLTLNTSTGAVTGIPTASGTFSVAVMDAAGHVAGGGGPSGLDLGTDASYIFIDTGSTHLGWNAYQLDGNVLFGQGLTVQLSGGNNGGLGAGDSVFADSTTNITGSLQNPITIVKVATSQTAAAAATAHSVSNFAKGLTATQTFGNISNTLTINGNGGLNVISVGNIQNATLTINGSANDFFVFNVSGQINTNHVMSLTGGVPASHILWNLTGTGTVLQTSGGNVLVGTFLATNGGAFQFSELQLTGELINTDGNIQLVSGNHTLIQVGFTPPPTLGQCVITVN